MQREDNEWPDSVVFLSSVTWASGGWIQRPTSLFLSPPPSLSFWFFVIPFSFSSGHDTSPCFHPHMHARSRGNLQLVWNHFVLQNIRNTVLHSNLPQSFQHYFIFTTTSGSALKWVHNWRWVRAGGQDCESQQGRTWLDNKMPEKQGSLSRVPQLGTG